MRALRLRESASGSGGPRSERYSGFEDWYHREHPRVLAALTVASGSPEAAREATDEAFSRALARWPRLQAMESPGGWLYTVGLNLVRRQARRAGSERRAQDRSGQPTVWHCDPSGEMWALVKALPSRQRAAVALRYLADMKEREIAEVMKVSPGTVASTLAAARSRLAAMLCDDEEVSQ